jgi:hypothetical protein
MLDLVISNARTKEKRSMQNLILAAVFVIVALASVFTATTSGSNPDLY